MSSPTSRPFQGEACLLRDYRTTIHPDGGFCLCIFHGFREPRRIKRNPERCPQPRLPASAAGGGHRCCTGLFLRRLQRRRRSCSNPPLRVKLEIPDKTKDQRIFYTGLFGGRGWIRTTEAESSRFTVCPHWPLGNTPIFNSQSHRLPVYITTGARVCQCFLRKFSCRGRK